MRKAPCKECENKGCGDYHSKCEKYLEYRRKIDEDKRIMQEKNRHYHDVIQIGVSPKKRRTLWIDK